MKGLACLITCLAFASSALAADPVRPPITGVSHIGLYAADASKSEAFYAHDLGATKGDDPENAAGTRYYFSPAQFVEILPLPAGVSKNRLDHVAFATTDAEALRLYLASRKVSVPAKVSTGKDGSRWFSVNDPEGNRVEFVQAPANLPNVPVNALSSHIIHVGFVVTIDRVKMLSTAISSASGPIGSVASRPMNPPGSASRCPMAPTGWNTCWSADRRPPASPPI